MAQWIEDIPQWVELYPDWVEGLATPQWVECGWAEFNPQWIDGPVCPTVTAPSTLGGAPQGPTLREVNRKKIQEDDNLCLQLLTRCATMVLGNPYLTGENRVTRHKM